jgi:predicted nucleic acid-binding protein
LIGGHIVIFLDSSAIIAFKNADDIHHKSAVQVFERIANGEYGQAVITEFIFSEVVTVLLLRVDLETAAAAGRVLEEAEEISILSGSRLFEGGWRVFQEQKGTELSFVDASSIACMVERGIKFIATFDKDFKKVDGVNVVS